MRVLITGGSGQLAHDIVLHCAGAGDSVWAVPHAELDVSDREAVLAAVSSFEPDAVVNCAAWTAVDACESDPARAFAVNALGVRHVAEACRRTGAHLLHVSTDYVFDGTQERPYHEWDAPNPHSVYGGSKLAGEVEALMGLPGSSVVRTSWVAGAHGHNIVRTILRLAQDPERSLAFVDDQRGSPTFTADLAPVLRRLAIERLPGLVHATNQGVTTWFGLARATLQAAGHDPERVRPISTADLDPPRPAPRPANSVLDNQVLRTWGIGPLPPWEEGLGRLVRSIVSAETPAGP